MKKDFWYGNETRYKPTARDGIEEMFDFLGDKFKQSKDAALSKGVQMLRKGHDSFNHASRVIKEKRGAK